MSSFIDLLNIGDFCSDGTP